MRNISLKYLLPSFNLSVPPSFLFSFIYLPPHPPSLSSFFCLPPSLLSFSPFSLSPFCPITPSLPLFSLYLGFPPSLSALPSRPPSVTQKTLSALSASPPPVLAGPAGTPHGQKNNDSSSFIPGHLTDACKHCVSQQSPLTLGACQASELFYLQRWQASNKSFPYKNPTAPKFLTAPALTDGSQNSPD